MGRRGQATDRHGITWVGEVVSKATAEEEDFDFWYDRLTPVERVATVEDCLLSARKARGLDAVPRLRRVSRVVQRKRS